MGLYNMLFGHNPHAPLVLVLLSAKPGDFGRFRDAWVEKTEDGGLRLAVYTRNGGGNRDSQSEAWDRIKAHALYLGDRDDPFDGTYATAYFQLPAELPPGLVELLPDDLKERAALVAKLREIAIDPPDMSSRWQKAIDAIGKPATN